VRIVTEEGGEKEMWCAVLHQALTDAQFGRPTEPNKMRWVDTDRAYFSMRNRDFITVCGLAGVDAKAVHDRAHALFEESPV
jgi:hypothetical protein